VRELTACRYLLAFRRAWRLLTERRMLSRLLVASLLFVGACTATPLPANADPEAAPSDPRADPPADPPPPSPLIVARPYKLKVPSGYDEATPAPLVIELHGYGQGDNAQTIDKWMQLAPLASERGYLLAIPGATEDHLGLPAWNATDACCDFDGNHVDDVTYLAAVIDDVARVHNLDKARVYVTGISGGAFMVHRLACDLADKIAAVVSISGATFDDETRCKPSSPVSIVELHGDADDTVPYAGGDGALPGTKVPSAQTTVARWAKYDGCTGALHERAHLDLETAVSGSETKVEAYDGCPQGISVELWTAEGGPHASEFTAAFRPALFDFFDAHPRR